jgi:hypothetical protein
METHLNTPLLVKLRKLEIDMDKKIQNYMNLEKISSTYIKCMQNQIGDDFTNENFQFDENMFKQCFNEPMK